MESYNKLSNENELEFKLSSIAAKHSFLYQHLSDYIEDDILLNYMTERLRNTILNGSKHSTKLIIATEYYINHFPSDHKETKNILDIIKKYDSNILKKKITNDNLPNLNIIKQVNNTDYDRFINYIIDTEHITFARAYLSLISNPNIKSYIKKCENMYDLSSLVYIDIITDGLDQELSQHILNYMNEINTKTKLSIHSIATFASKLSFYNYFIGDIFNSISYISYNKLEYIRKVIEGIFSIENVIKNKIKNTTKANNYFDNSVISFLNVKKNYLQNILYDEFKSIKNQLNSIEEKYRRENSIHTLRFISSKLKKSRLESLKRDLNSIKEEIDLVTSLYRGHNYARV